MLTHSTNAGPTQPPRDSQPGPKAEKNVPILKRYIHKTHSLIPRFWRKGQKGRERCIVGSIEHFIVLVDSTIKLTAS